MTTRIPLSAALMCLVAGCARAPANSYFMLSATSPSAKPSVSDRSFSDGLNIGVHLPGLLDRTQIVLRTGTHSVALREFDRWAEPLDQMVPRILNQDVVMRLSKEQPNAFPSTSEHRISVKVDVFVADQAGEAYLSGSWRPASSGGSPATLPATRFDLSTPLASTRSDDIAASMSDLLGSLADQIVQASPP